MREHNGYNLVKDEQWGTMFRVAPIGKGGSIPSVLSGLFSTVAEATKAIDLYRSSYKKKVKANATKLSDG